MKRKLKRILTYFIITLLFAAYGLIPFRLPDANPVIDENNKLLVTPQDCTACGDFCIIKGNLIIPYEFQHLGPISNSDIFITNKEPFKLDYDYYIKNYVIKGNVVGIDSSDWLGIDKSAEKMAIFEISEWNPTEYCPNYCSFNIWFSLFYFLIIFGLLITLLVLFIDIIVLMMHMP